MYLIYFVLNSNNDFSPETWIGHHPATCTKYIAAYDKDGKVPSNDMMFQGITDGHPILYIDGTYFGGIAYMSDIEAVNSKLANISKPIRIGKISASGTYTYTFEQAGTYGIFARANASSANMQSLININFKGNVCTKFRCNRW